ncbi:TetR/AcrR family transcriptional regulator [Labedella phragmitis]|uniref:TetR/AcrR family transcriptional regulator n=1 Tax=Labedella phragmitis TaxID=2498849 RepID=A0A3S4ANX6_9MICO|nr:TetR/AcrR family transcriptional regulator [Labedella phragmitis]RWZ52698.1 TetR/AcrR family transcriptional regulator [Labedella phragmitis]
MVLRVDARQNRDRIVDAAQDLFASEGLETPMSEIARRAGVGAATLSRRFPTRESLIDAVFERQLGWWMSAVDAVEKAPDAWVALSDLLEQACVEQAREQVCADLVVRAFFNGTSFDAEKAILRSTIERVLDAAKEAGTVRDDVVWDDIVLLIEANAGAANLVPSDSEASARRLAQHFLRSFTTFSGGR